MSTAGTLASLAAGTVAAAATGLGYAAGVERRHWTLRRVELPVLEPGARRLRILHLSDFHLTPGQLSKIRWIAALDALEPDLVINTGDNLAHPDAVPGVLAALGPLLDRPGAFVFGSNDYYGPTAKNPARYLRRSDTRRRHGEPLPWSDLRAAFREHGWVDATHTREQLTVDGRTVRVAGVDDPHLHRDRYPRIAGYDPDADLRLGLTHSPEPRVLDGFAADGYDLVLAGHTHGGQLRLPGYGAIVTNCGIDRSRARGVSRWGSHLRLHVSAGLGTSPYAPVRFACPPEASLLTLVPRPTGAATGRGAPAHATTGVG
ncbi:metallophosphoesterase [Pseudonocardia nantongensis]|uniref:metallophosphoesterase n=1 Tax=Pseudonocardia nantongensis TaxID=1181885 RepID=UPI00397E5638